jgi:hypothetical protein
MDDSDQYSFDLAILAGKEVHGQYHTFFSQTSYETLQGDVYLGTAELQKELNGWLGLNPSIRSLEFRIWGGRGGNSSSTKWILVQTLGVGSSVILSMSAACQPNFSHINGHQLS